MKALFSLSMVLLMSFAASANDFAAAVGFRSNSADAVNAGVTTSSKTGFGAGVIGFFDMSEKVQIRSGFLYSPRDITIKSGTTEYDMNAAYIDIPVTAMYRFADYGGAFAGPVLGLLASKNCKIPGCTDNPSGTVLGLQFGVSFKFAPQLGAEFYYETIPSEYWSKHLENMRTVGANLLFTFE